MGKLGDFILKNSKPIFAILLIGTLGAIFLSSKLTIRPGFVDLLPENDPYVQVYRKAVENFKSVDSIIIGVEGEREDIINYINSLSEELKNMEYVDAIYYKNPIDFISKNIFLLSSDEEQEYLKKLYSSANIVDFFEALNEIFKESKSSYKITEQDKKQFDYMLKAFNHLLESIEQGNQKRIKENLLNMLLGKKYLISNDGNFGMIIIRPTISSNDVEKAVKLVNAMEKIVKERAKKFNVNAGLTGTLVIARDEMVTSERDMIVATTVSLILIILIFVLGFKSFRYMFLAIVPLVLGIIWAMGFTKISIGSLNIMTVMMIAILAGLGIDYSIHMISLFVELRNQGKSIKESILGVFEKNIRGVIAGSITTAIGMGIFVISSFPGFREFGIALSSGIIFTLLAAIFGLTLLLKKFGNKYKDPGRIFTIDFNIKKYRTFVIIVTILFLVLSIIKIPNVRFEKNMMKIEAKGLESIELNKKILKKFGFSPDNTIFISKNLSEAKALYDKLKDSDVFSEIDSIAPFLPDTKKQVLRLKNVKEVKRIPNEVADFDIKRLKLEINKLGFNMSKAVLSLNLIGQKELSKKIQDIIKSGVLIKITNKRKAELEKIQNELVSTIFNLKNDLNDSELITLNNLPEDIKGNYLGNGMVLTTAYSNGDIWNLDYQKDYFSALDKLNLKNVSGSALIFLRLIQIAAKEGRKVLLLTIILILIVLLIDMRSIKYALLSILPMILSIIMMLGIMGWFEIKFNVVNVIALPLIIGIGVDDGIHLIHRYRREKKNLRTSLRSTGKAITMTTLTTSAAFGSFVLSKYRGFIGFGLLLLIGIVFSYLITVSFVTSIISYLDKE